jgi:DNA-binding NarL/FixJ family response regulator
MPRPRTPRLRQSDYDELGTGRIFPSSDPARGRLTPIEHAVAQLIADGLKSAEIADRLGVGTDAVRNRVDAMKRRLGLATREEIGAWVRARRMPGSRDGRLWRIGDARPV